MSNLQYEVVMFVIRVVLIYWSIKSFALWFMTMNYWYNDSKSNFINYLVIGLPLMYLFVLYQGSVHFAHWLGLGQWYEGRS